MILARNHNKASICIPAASPNNPRDYVLLYGRGWMERLHRMMHRLLNKKQSPLSRAIAAACLEACMTLLESARQGK